MVSGDGRFSFFRLDRYAESLRAGLSPSALEAEREAALHPVLETWGPGFYGPEEGEDGPFRWSGGRGEITLLNPSPVPRQVELALTLSTVSPEPSSIRWKGPGEKTEFRVDGRGRTVRRALVVPPGTSRVTLTGTGPRVRPEGDIRTLSFRVEGLTIAEPGAVAAGTESESRRR